MSIALAKKSLRSFELPEGQKDKSRKRRRTKPTEKASPDQDDKIKKLLLLGNSNLDEKLSKRLLRKATKSKRATLHRSTKSEDREDQTPAQSESAFTEQDFANFEEELKRLN